jgi:DeoR family glycerol-3-phosphate regulon repressor
MISRARRTIVLADSSKLGRIAAFNVAKAEDIDILVSGSDVGTGFAAAIKTKGIEFR